MSAPQNFRTSFNGFNREDVVHYLEYLNSRHQAQVDMLSRLHLLIPVAPKIYHYMSFNSDGALLENSYWKVFGTVPMLYRNPKTGQVTRMGGEPAKEGVDYDDPKKGSLTVAEILDGDNNSKPAPHKDGGVVDLGEGLMPVKAADED